MTFLSFTLNVLLLHKDLQRRGEITEVFLEVEPFEGDLEGDWELQLVGWWNGRALGLRVRHPEQLVMARDGSRVDGTGEPLGTRSGQGCWHRSLRCGGDGLPDSGSRRGLHTEGCISWQLGSSTEAPPPPACEQVPEDFPSTGLLSHRISRAVARQARGRSPTEAPLQRVGEWTLT